MIGLVDSDILCYRVGFASNDEAESVALTTMDGFITDLMMDEPILDVMKFEFYLTGTSNYRNDIAVTRPYKGNRKSEKPVHLQALRNHLIDVWGAVVSDGNEADDMMAIRQHELNFESIIISLDKDLDMVEGWHYNFVKRERYHISDDEGMYNFYTQILTGDKVDNIQGVHRCGPKKAEKILDGLVDELEMWEAVVEAHGSEERALEDARLLWMQTKEGELWLPPNQREE